VEENKDEFNYFKNRNVMPFASGGKNIENKLKSDKVVLQSLYSEKTKQNNMSASPSFS